MSRGTRFSLLMVGVQLLAGAVGMWLGWWMSWPLRSLLGDASWFAPVWWSTGAFHGVLLIGALSKRLWDARAALWRAPSWSEVSQGELLEVARLGVRCASVISSGTLLSVALHCVLSQSWLGLDLANALALSAMLCGALTLSHLAGYVCTRAVIGWALTQVPLERLEAGVSRYLETSRTPPVVTQLVCACFLPVLSGALLLAYFSVWLFAVNSARHQRWLDADRLALEAVGLAGTGVGSTLALAPEVPLGRDALVWVMSALALVTCALVGFYSRSFARSYVAELARMGDTLRSMGESEGHRARDLRRLSVHFRDVSAVQEAVRELDDVFRRFAATQRQAANEQQHTARMRSQFLAAMSHDLKGPLNLVLGFSELLQRHPLTPEQLESIAIIRERGEELLLLIVTVLDSARYETQPLPLRPKRQHLDALVAAALDQAERLGDAEAIAGNARALPRRAVFCDGERMTVALLLLLRTAVRLTAAGQKVSLELASGGAGEAVQLIIESPGGSLSTPELAHFFRAFHHTAEARKLGSLGLGLQLAEAIVVQSGGSVDVHAHSGGAVGLTVELPTTPSP